MENKPARTGYCVQMSEESASENVVENHHIKGDNPDTIADSPYYWAQEEPLEYDFLSAKPYDTLSKQVSNESQPLDETKMGFEVVLCCGDVTADVSEKVPDDPLALTSQANHSGLHDPLRTEDVKQCPLPLSGPVNKKKNKKCRALNCPVTSFTHPTEMLHRFPCERRRFNRWVELAEYEHDGIRMNFYLCQRHFKWTDYLFVGRRRWKIRHGADPAYRTGPLNPLTGDYCPDRTGETASTVAVQQQSLNCLSGESSSNVHDHGEPQMTNEEENDMDIKDEEGATECDMTIPIPGVAGCALCEVMDIKKEEQPTDDVITNQECCDEKLTAESVIDVKTGFEVVMCTDDLSNDVTIAGESSNCDPLANSVGAHCLLVPGAENGAVEVVNLPTHSKPSTSTPNVKTEHRQQTFQSSGHQTHTKSVIRKRKEMRPREVCDQGIQRPLIPKTLTSRRRNQFVNPKSIPPAELSNKVDFIVENLARLKVEDKIVIRDKGRPIPDLNIVQVMTSRQKDWSRRFNSSRYAKTDWLCGCEVREKLFCFPCLLCSKERDGPWVATGVRDLAHLTQKMKRHEASITHRNAKIDMKLLGKTNILQRLDSGYRIGVAQKNEIVRKNRYYLSRIIDCITFCAINKLPLRGHGDSNSANGIFGNLVDFSANIDDVMKRYIEQATGFKATSKEIQNDILDAMLTVCMLKIKEQIGCSKYVSVIVDEVTDISLVYQISVAFRYVLPEGEPVERFWTFLKPENRDGVSFASCIKQELVRAGVDKNKLISQSYDGAYVMSDVGAHVIIKNDYPYASLIHSYAHQLNLTLKRAIKMNKEVRIFFADLDGIPAFFNSPQRLSEIVGRSLPSSSGNCWNFDEGTVTQVYEHFDSLVRCLKKVEEESNSEISISEARGHRLKMVDRNFRFWLTVFYPIMKAVDTLFSQLQKSSRDPVKTVEKLREFEVAIQKARDGVNVSSIDVNVIKRPRLAEDEDEVSTKKAAAKEVCDVILHHICERFAFTGHLTGSKLLDFSEFQAFRKRFPEDILDQFCSCYSFFNRAQLKADLEILYSRDDFGTQTGAVPLLSFFINDGISEVLPEVTSLLILLICIPMTTSEAERIFSTLPRIKTALRSTIGEDRAVALSMLSIEKDLVSGIGNFNEKVIDVFAAKEDRRADWFYTNII